MRLNAGSVTGFLDFLDDGERARAARFHREEDRNRFVLGRALIRRVCAAQLGLPEASVPLTFSGSGKPGLDPSCGCELEFNVSHAGDWVLGAWCEGGAVGVDVETLGHRLSAPVLEIAARVFSAAEMNALRIAAPVESLPVFFRIWSRKEALLKAEGWGLGGPLQSFDVARVDGATVVWPERVVSPASGRVWQMTDLPGPDGYVAVLASPSGSLLKRVEASVLGFR